MRHDLALKILLVVAERINLSSKHERQASQTRSLNSEMSALLRADAAEPEEIRLLARHPRKSFHFDAISHHAQQARYAGKRTRLRFRNTAEPYIRRNVLKHLRRVK